MTSLDSSFQLSQCWKSSPPPTICSDTTKGSASWHNISSLQSSPSSTAPWQADASHCQYQLSLPFSRCNHPPWFGRIGACTPVWIATMLQNGDCDLGLVAQPGPTDIHDIHQAASQQPDPHLVTRCRVLIKFGRFEGRGGASSSAITGKCSLWL